MESTTTGEAAVVVTVEEAGATATEEGDDELAAVIVGLSMSSYSNSLSEKSEPLSNYEKVDVKRKMANGDASCLHSY